MQRIGCRQKSPIAFFWAKLSDKQCGRLWCAGGDKMSALNFLLGLILVQGLLVLAIFSGRISAAAVSFFYGSANRRARK
jgi:hypothetical protein